MKINITENKYKKEKPFPKLMISDRKVVVLFRKPKKGTVLYPNDYRLGKYSSNFNMENFKDFFGTIELEEKRYEN